MQFCLKQSTLGPVICFLNCEPHYCRLSGLVKIKLDALLPAPLVASYSSRIRHRSFSVLYFNATLGDSEQWMIVRSSADYAPIVLPRAQHSTGWSLIGQDIYISLNVSDSP